MGLIHRNASNGHTECGIFIPHLPGGGRLYYFPDPRSPGAVVAEGNEPPGPVTCPDCLARRRASASPIASTEPRGLRIITVYAHPRDFPGEFVARESFTNATGERKDEIVARGPDLESCRAAIIALDLGLVCLARHPEDDPVIVETWI